MKNTFFTLLVMVFFSCILRGQSLDAILDSEIQEEQQIHTISPDDLVLDFKIDFPSFPDSNYCYVGYTLTGYMVLESQIEKDIITGVMIPEEGFRHIVKYQLINDKSEKIESVITYDTKPHDDREGGYGDYFIKNIYHYSINTSNLLPGEYTFKIVIDDKYFPGKKIIYPYIYYDDELNKDVENGIEFEVKKIESDEDKENAEIHIFFQKIDNVKKDNTQDNGKVLEEALKMLDETKNFNNRCKLTNVIIDNLFRQKSYDGISWLLCQMHFSNGDTSLRLIDIDVNGYFGGWEPLLKEEKNILKTAREIEKKYYLPYLEKNIPAIKWDIFNVKKLHERCQELQKATETEEGEKKTTIYAYHKDITLRLYKNLKNNKQKELKPNLYNIYQLAYALNKFTYQREYLPYPEVYKAFKAGDIKNQEDLYFIPDLSKPRIRTKFLYRGGMKYQENGKDYVLAYPQAENGRRAVMLTSGDVVEVPEEEFLKQAEKQGFPLK